MIITRKQAFISFLVGLLLSLSFPGYAEEPFRLGVVNERPDRPDHALKQYLPLNNYLKHTLAKHNITVAPLTVAHSIEELGSLIQAGKLDAVFEGVMPSLILKKRTHSLYPELLIWRKNQRQYHSVFFVHKKSALKSLEDISDKTIVFEAPRSTSAYFIPKITLESLGYQLVELENLNHNASSKKTLSYIFSGSEANQAYWVHNGKADIGAFNNGDWERVPDVIKQDLKIIGQTKPVLRWLFSYTTATQTPAKDIINRVLLETHLSEEGQQALKAAANIKKMEPLTETDHKNLQYWNNLLHK